MAAPMLKICQSKFPLISPFLCRTKSSYKPWLKKANTLSGTKRYRGPPINLEEIRNRGKRRIPLFFGQSEKHHPVTQATGSLGWAEPIFEDYKKKVENVDDNGNPLQEVKDEDQVYPLHAVRRKPKTLFGVQKRLKKIMTIFGLHPDQVPKGQFVILPNSEIINQYLREVKGLVDVKPVKYDGPELTDDDLEHMYLTENAELIVNHKVHALNVVDERDLDKWSIEKDTIVVRNRRRIQEQRVSLEYFPPKYVYRYNQDGKEYRYTHNEAENKSDSSS